MTNSVFIAGAGGGIGFRVLTQLNSSGFTVSGTSKNKSLGTPGFFNLDLRDFKTTSDFFREKKPSCVVHFAHQKNHANSEDNGTYKNENLRITQNLLENAKENSCSRFLFASSAAVYGDQGNCPASESAQLNPTSEYAELKIQSEELISTFCRENGIEHVNMRIFNVYGLGFESSLINRIVKSSPNHKISLIGGDSFVRDYIHVSDVASATERLLDLKSQPPSTINIGTGIPTSNKMLLSMIPGQLISNLILEDSFHSYSVADISLARKVLRFSPEKLTSELIWRLFVSS